MYIPAIAASPALMNSMPVYQPEVLSDEELRSLLRQYRRENWQGIQTAEWQERIVESIVRDDGEAVLERVGAFWNIPSGALVLDIGSGVGSFVLGCRRRGLLAFGIEPDRIGRGGALTSVQIARRRIEEQAFAVAVGEKLPFADCSFDLIVMNQVMEHVADQAALLRESLRVLKPGGAVYIACPNYLRFYEPHYKIFWFPLLPKLLGRAYLRFRGRNPVLLGQLTYTTNGRIRRLLSKCGSGYSFLDLNREEFLEKFNQNSFVSWRARLVARAMRLPMIGQSMSRAATKFISLTEGGSEMLVLRETNPKGVRS
ncbi:MAG TPA: class I SAM-dependent methyltransferase [Terriglobales bacterium]|jgi:SAM-dependent methyltransferase|nr:class I SAM-dependent methyltransferase [Terriglobales bacterium]